VELTVEYSRLAEWISDVKRIIEMDLHESGKAKYVLLAADAGRHLCTHPAAANALSFAVG
jgi:hypothetical protein